jgi:hypothetical protein
LKTTEFIKRVLGSKKVEKKEDRPATELTLRVIEAQIAQTKEILSGMSGNMEKIAKGMDSLSRYFELEIKRTKDMEEVESIAPSKADLLY